MKDSLVYLIEQLSPYDRLCLVTFSTSAKRLNPLLPVTPPNKQLLLQYALLSSLLSARFTLILVFSIMLRACLTYCQSGESFDDGGGHKHWLWERSLEVVVFCSAGAFKILSLPCSY